MKRRKYKASIVLLSGGIDSTACTHFLINQGFSVTGFFVDYGQLSRRYEEASAREVCNFYGIELKTCLISSDVFFKTGEIVGRNASLIFLALMFSGLKQGIISLGVHSGIPYYDCSLEFFNQANSMIQNYSSGKIILFAPFLDWTKSDIIRYCKENNIPLNLTYSCERGAQPPCGKCDSCRDRNQLIC